MTNVKMASQKHKPVRMYLRSAKAGEVHERPDFSLIRDVQMRATGANIHAVSQQLQIYVSAIECGAMSHAQAVESHLRAFLAASR